jgi:hypothetical protein
MSFPYLQQQQQTKKLPATNMVVSTYSINSFLLELEPTSVLSASFRCNQPPVLEWEPVLQLLVQLASYWNWNSLQPPSGATGLLLEPEPVVLIFSLCYEPASGATRAGTGCCDIEFVIIATLWRNQPATGTRTCCALILS